MSSSHATAESEAEYQRVLEPAKTYTPGSYTYTIYAPVWANGATISMTRGAGWPPSTVFSYQIYEQDRFTNTLRPLFASTESGGTFTDRSGVVNPPYRVRLTWPVDADRDVIMFTLSVVQTFTTAITMEFFV